MKTRILALLVFAIITLAVVFFAPENIQKTQMPDKETVIPEGYTAQNNFTFTDPLGVKYELADFAGRNVVVCFWASWNATSRALLDHVEAAIPTYYDQAVFLPINVGKAGKDGLKKAQAVMTAGEYTFPLYIDKTGVAHHNVTFTPQTYVFDGMGNLLECISGDWTEDTLTHIFTEILAPVE